MVRCGIAEASGQPAPMGQKTKYKDGMFEKMFMSLFARKMEKFGRGDTTAAAERGLFDYDYESFVETSRKVMEGRTRLQQQQVVREVLLSMLPPGAPEQVYIFSLSLIMYIFVIFLYVINFSCCLVY